MARAMLAAVALAACFVEQGVPPSPLSLERHIPRSQLTLCWVLHPFCRIRTQSYASRCLRAGRGDFDRARNQPCAPSFWRTFTQCLEGNCGFKRGEFGNGLGAAYARRSDLLEDRVDDSYPECWGALAESLAGLGKVHRLARHVDRALAVADRWWRALGSWRSSCASKGELTAPWSR